MKKNLLTASLFFLLVSSISLRNTHAMNQLPQSETETTASGVLETEEFEDLSAAPLLPDDVWFVVCIFLPIDDLQSLSFVSHDFNNKVRNVMKIVFGDDFDTIRLKGLVDLNCIHGDLALSLYLSAGHPHVDERSTFAQAFRRALQGIDSPTPWKVRKPPYLCFLLYRDLIAALVLAENGKFQLAAKQLRAQMKKLETLASTSFTYGSKKDNYRNHGSSDWTRITTLTRSTRPIYHDELTDTKLHICRKLNLTTYAKRFLQLLQSKGYIFNVRMLLDVAMDAVETIDVELAQFIFEELRCSEKLSLYNFQSGGWDKHIVSSLSELCQHTRKRPNYEFRGTMGGYFNFRDSLLHILEIAKQSENSTLIEAVSSYLGQDTEYSEQDTEDSDLGEITTEFQDVCCTIL